MQGFDNTYALIWPENMPASRFAVNRDRNEAHDIRWHDR